MTVALASCGTDGDFANRPRPPAPINVTAAVTGDSITVSPRSFGAGPVVLIISNQTDRSHRVTVETDVLGSSSPGLRQRTPPINPHGTATLKVDMPKGRYVVSVDGGRVGTATLRVGRERPSSQDQLLQP